MPKVVLKNLDGSSLTVEILTSAVTFITSSPDGDEAVINVSRSKARLLGKWLRIRNV